MSIIMQIRAQTLQLHVTDSLIIITVSTNSLCPFCLLCLCSSYRLSPSDSSSLLSSLSLFSPLLSLSLLSSPLSSLAHTLAHRQMQLLLTTSKNILSSFPESLVSSKLHIFVCREVTQMWNHLSQLQHWK